MMSTTEQLAPRIGMGVTVLCWTDRIAGTIIRVTPKTVHVQRDKVTRVDKRGMSEAQEYQYTPDPGGTVYVFRMTKRGYRCGTQGLLIGDRREYRDYSF